MSILARVADWWKGECGDCQEKKNAMWKLKESKGHCGSKSAAPAAALIIFAGLTERSPDLSLVIMSELEAPTPKVRNEKQGDGAPIGRFIRAFPGAAGVA